MVVTWPDALNASARDGACLFAAAVGIEREDALAPVDVRGSETREGGGARLGGWEVGRHTHDGAGDAAFFQRYPEGRALSQIRHLCGRQRELPFAQRYTALPSL